MYLGYTSICKQNMKELQFFVCKYVQICCTVCKLRECDLGDAARVSCHAVVTPHDNAAKMLRCCSRLSEMETPAYADVTASLSCDVQSIVCVMLVLVSNAVYYYWIV